LAAEGWEEATRTTRALTARTAASIGARALVVLAPKTVTTGRPGYRSATASSSRSTASALCAWRVVALGGRVDSGRVVSGVSGAWRVV